MVQTVSDNTTVNGGGQAEDTLSLDILATRPLPAGSYDTLRFSVGSLLLDASEGNNRADQWTVQDQVVTLNGTSVVDGLGADSIRLIGNGQTRLTVADTTVEYGQRHRRRRRSDASPGGHPGDVRRNGGACYGQRPDRGDAPIRVYRD